MEIEGSLLCSQEPTTDPVHSFHPICVRSIPILSSYLRLSIPSGLPFGFSDQNFVCISHVRRFECPNNIL